MGFCPFANCDCQEGDCVFFDEFSCDLIGIPDYLSEIGKQLKDIAQQLDNINLTIQRK